MSPITSLRASVLALLILVAFPLVAYRAIAFALPVALLAGALLLASSRPRLVAGLIGTTAALVGGGVIWATWILGVIINRNSVEPGLDFAMAVAFPVVAAACLVAAIRVWRSTSRERVPG